MDRFKAEGGVPLGCQCDRYGLAQDRRFLLALEVVGLVIVEPRLDSLIQLPS